MTRWKDRQQLLDAWTAEKERRMLSDAGLIINDDTGFVDEFMANPLCESVVRGLEVVRVPAINPASGITEIKLNGVTLKTYSIKPFSAMSCYCNHALAEKERSKNQLKISVNIK